MNPDVDLIEQYLDNIEKMHALSVLTFPAETAGKDILRGLQDACEQSAAIRQENYRLLRDPSLGLYTPVENMTSAAGRYLEAVRRSAFYFCHAQRSGTFLSSS